MTVLLATIGFTADSILPTVRNIGGVSRVVLFWFEDEEGDVLAAVKEASAALRGMKIPVARHRLRDGYDYAMCLDEMLSVAQSIERGSLAIDATGGTKVMAFAAFTCAWICGSPLLYNDERKPVADATKRIPVQGLAHGQDLAGTRASLVEVLNERDSSLPQLKARLRRSAPVIVHHINHLEGAGLVQRVRAAQDRREVTYALTDVGRIAARVARRPK